MVKWFQKVGLSSCARGALLYLLRLSLSYTGKTGKNYSKLSTKSDGKLKN